MSRGTDKDDSVREPSVYVQSTMDSFLEKKSQVLRTKTRIRCCLYGSTLYEQKDQDIKIHDMRTAQTVRKVANDSTGTQFEIVLKKKTHTYICSSSEECKDWISALLKCMMLKDSSDSNSNSLFYTDAQEDQVYSVIDGSDALPCSGSESNTGLINDYSTPGDAVEENVTKNNVYEDVDLRQSADNFGSEDTQNDHSKGESIYNVYSDGISDHVDPSYSYAKVVKKTVDPLDDLVELEDALADSGFVLDDLPHSLSSDDLLCIKTLKTFLRSNDMYRRSTSLRNSKNEDCLSALKTCLSTISID